MARKNPKAAPTTPKNSKFWEFRNQAGNTVELLLYGDISQTSWWEDEVTPRQFADELAGLGALDKIVVRINSGGGDVFAAQAIGNLLEQHPAEVSAKIDGLCASAATIVACHCGKVIAANDSTYMVHPVRIGASGYYTEKELQEYTNALAAIRENIVQLYVKKTGHEADQVAAWMDATSWWTAAQAKENGFVDELVDEGSAVVENRGGQLFVNSVAMHLPFDRAPEFVQNRMKADTAAAGFENTPPAAQPGQTHHEEVSDMEINTVNDLRRAYSELVTQAENAAAAAERTRIREIEESTLPGSESVAYEAKFVKPVNSADFAKAVIASMKKKEQEQSAGYLDAARAGAENSGANSVGNAAPPQDPGKGDNPFLAAVRKANNAK